MARNEDEQQALGPSVVMGLIGAVFVLLLLAGGIWGVGKIVERIRESSEETQEETTEEVAEEESAEEESAEEESVDEGMSEEEASQEESTEEEGSTEESEVQEEEGDVNGDAVSDENIEEEESEAQEEESTSGIVGAVWVANDYKKGDISGDSYEVVWGDTLWEISEARYGDGFEWTKIRDANSGDVGYLPNGSQALIFPGQVLTLP